MGKMKLNGTAKNVCFNGYSLQIFYVDNQDGRLKKIKLHSIILHVSIEISTDCNLLASFDTNIQ